MSEKRRDVEEAYREASRGATRSSFMGAMGFGLALLMAAIITDRGSFLGGGLGLQKLLFAGGVTGGLVFTLLAVRASRAARQCRQRLDDMSRSSKRR